MHAPAPGENVTFEYAIIRVVPRVERGEFVNAGVIVFCLAHKVLLALVETDEGKLNALWPDVDIAIVHESLRAIVRVCDGTAEAGPIARLTARERFHWLVSPRSTMIQVSPVHSGLCVSPHAELKKLFRQFVE